VIRGYSAPMEGAKLQRIDKAEGGLDVLELPVAVPFPVHRLYWLRDTPSGQDRGLHAHRTLRQLLVIVTGSVTVDVDDGFTVKRHVLDEASPTLIIEPIRWRVLSDFEPGTLVMVLASDPYDPDDYIHDYAVFQQVVRGG
jgi:hypothetical protein